MAVETAGVDPAALGKLLAEVNTPVVGAAYDPAGLLIDGFEPLSGMEPLADHILNARIRDAVAGTGQRPGARWAWDAGRSISRSTSRCWTRRGIAARCSFAGLIQNGRWKKRPRRPGPCSHYSGAVSMMRRVNTNTHSLRVIRRPGLWQAAADFSSIRFAT